MIQQPLLSLQPPGIAGQLAPAAHNPVAGNKKRQRIAAHSPANGPRGRMQPVSQILIGHRLSIRDLQKLVPNGDLKGRSRGMELGTLELAALKVGLKPGRSLFQRPRQVPLAIAAGRSLCLSNKFRAD